MCIRDRVKYVNSPESEIYHKSNELYGIYFAKQAIVKQDVYKRQILTWSCGLELWNVSTMQA